MPPVKPITIICDMREERSGIPKTLANLPGVAEASLSGASGLRVTITPDTDRIARVPARVVGTVAQHAQPAATRLLQALARRGRLGRDRWFRLAHLVTFRVANSAPVPDGRFRHS